MPGPQMPPDNPLAFTSDQLAAIVDAARACRRSNRGLSRGPCQPAARTFTAGDVRRTAAGTGWSLFSEHKGFRSNPSDTRSNKHDIALVIREILGRDADEKHPIARLIEDDRIAMVVIGRRV
jgi:hypothetical protein